MQETKSQKLKNAVMLVNCLEYDCSNKYSDARSWLPLNDHAVNTKFLP